MATIKRYIYAFDPTGRLEANLIRNERHTITPENRTPQNVLIPGFAPYFRQSLIVTDIHTGRPLQEGIDYTCEWPVLSTADNTEGYTPLYGGIQFIDNAITGQFELQYQTIGGQYALDGVTIAQALANQANDPLTTTYEDIIGRPLKLPPLEHVHSIEDFVGFEDLCREIVLLKEAIELLAREDRDSHPGYDTLVDSYFRLELLMEQNKEAIQTLKEDTKNKLQEVRDDLTSLINQTKNNLEDRINQVNNTLTQDLNTAKTELSNAIQQLNTNLTKLINTLRTDFDEFVKGTFYPATGEKAQDVNKFFNDTKNGFINGGANVTDSRSPTLGVLATLPNGTYDYTGITTTSGGQTTQLISLGETYHYFRTKDTAGNDWYNELIVTNDNIDRVLKGLGNVVFTTTNQDVDGLKTFLKELKVKYSGTNPNYTGSLLRMGVNDVGAYLVNSTGLQLNNYKPGVSNKYLLLKDNGEVQTHLGQVVHSNDSYILGPRVSATSWTGVNLFIDNQGFKYEVNPDTRTFKLRREAVTGGKGAIDIDFQDKTGIVALLSDLTPFATTTITTGIRNDLNALKTEVGGLGTSLASNYVTLNTDQTITGSKMFKRAVHINIDGQAKGQLTLTQDQGALIHANGSTQNTHIRLTDDGYIDFHATNLNDDTSGGGGIRLAGDGALVLTKGIQDGRKVILMSDVSVNDIYIRSDKRLKENIEPIDNGLETILNLKGRTFDWKGSGRHAAGFIAQEVAEANRDLVSCASDEQKTMSVNYVDIIAYLVEAVKTQQKQIDELSNEIKSLKQQ